MWYSIFMSELEEGRAIPRLYKLSYLQVALVEIAQKASFERIRQALLRFAERTGEEQMVPGVVSRLRDNYTFWSPTQEALSELMRLHFVRQASVPSSRRYVDAYRATTYELTPNGTRAVSQLGTRDPQARSSFLDILSTALVETHPDFADLLEAADNHPLCIPEYTVGKITNLIHGGAGSQRLADDAISRMTRHWPEGIQRPNANDLVSQITDSLNRRFPSNRAQRPSQKDVLDTVDAAVLNFTARARNIHLDATSFNVCMSWAGQLAILEESRYVEDWPGRTVWATAKIHDHGIQRRGFKEAGDTVIQMLWSGFIKVAEAMPDARSSGYLPIYRVRAQAAFGARVNIRLVDIFLARLLSEEIEAPYRVQVALGRGMPPPRSEPIFTHQGRRFFDIMMTEQTNKEV